MNPLKQEASREEKCPPLCVCGCPRDRHEIEPPYPCYDCGCEIYTIGHKGSATAQTPEIVIERCQFGAWEREHHPEADDREHLEYERVSTGLSSGICAYGYIERKGTAIRWLKLADVPPQFRRESAPPVETPTKEAYEGMAQGNASPEPPDTTGRPESTGFEVLVKIHTKDADQKLHSPELLRFLVGKVIDSRYRLEEEIDYTLEVKRVYR